MAIYLHGHSEVVLRAHRGRTAAYSAAHLLLLLEPGMSLLDVGCGEGGQACCAPSATRPAGSGSVDELRRVAPAR